LSGSEYALPSGSAPVPDWAAEEIRATWRAARDAGNQLDSFRIIERMVDRLGYRRTKNNPSLVPHAQANQTPERNVGGMVLPVVETSGRKDDGQ
jgi:hypothetical protein